MDKKILIVALIIGVILISLVSGCVQIGQQEEKAKKLGSPGDFISEIEDIKSSINEIEEVMSSENP